MNFIIYTVLSTASQLGDLGIIRAKNIKMYVTDIHMYILKT